MKDLPSGTYTLKVTSGGFAEYEQQGVTIAAGRTTHLSVRLVLASLQQTVGVTATQSTFDTPQTSSVVNIDRDRVEELPIPNRNYLTFVMLAPPVAAANPAVQQSSGVQSGTGSFSFGGLRPGSNAVYIAGEAVRNSPQRRSATFKSSTTGSRRNRVAAQAGRSMCKRGRE